MVYSVARIPRPRTLQEPPQQLCERLRVQLARIAPGHPSLNLPFDWHLPDILEDSIAEVQAAKAAAQPQQSAMVERLQRAFYAKEQEYHRELMRAEANNKRLWQLAQTHRHRIMRLLPDYRRDFPRLNSVPKFVSYDQAKAANDDLELRIFELQHYNSQFNAADEFEKCNDRAERMCYALHDLIINEVLPLLKNKQEQPTRSIKRKAS